MTTITPGIKELKSESRQIIDGEVSKDNEEQGRDEGKQEKNNEEQIKDEKYRK
ncbi:hypothetical protein FACS1894152_6030 [Bacilli bacterium]|nr:hypothetical protein FACS1894152_6030 [Bacilli bacterium]